MSNERIPLLVSLASRFQSWALPLCIAAVLCIPVIVYAFVPQARSFIDARVVRSVETRVEVPVTPEGYEEKMKDYESKVGALREELRGVRIDQQKILEEFSSAREELVSVHDELVAQATRLNRASASAPREKVESGERGEAKISINDATESQLDELPGIGPSLAAAIVSYRQEHGPFESVDDLDSVSGIGPSLLEKIREHVSV